MGIVKRLRVYADTSVFGGCFDDEFDSANEEFFREVRTGRFNLVISDAVVRELQEAPERVRRLLAELPEEHVELVTIDEEVASLRDAYLSAGVLGFAAAADAEHIAAATVAEVDLVVSWNFKHIVHFDRIRGFNGVNTLNRYRPLEIHSPREVVEL